MIEKLVPSEIWTGDLPIFNPDALINLCAITTSYEIHFSSSIEYRVLKLEYRVLKLEYRVLKLEYRVLKLEYRVWKLEYRVWKREYRVWKLEYRVWKLRKTRLLMHQKMTKLCCQVLNSL